MSGKKKQGRRQDYDGAYENPGPSDDTSLLSDPLLTPSTDTNSTQKSSMSQSACINLSGVGSL